MMTLESLNSFSLEEAIREFKKCCGTFAWAKKMAEARPFADKDELHAKADRIWNTLAPADWREAFDHHPRIGGSDELRKKFAETNEWASEEQRGVSGAPIDVISALTEANRNYEARFGHIFLVCATGKTAAEMLAILESRMKNTPEAELKVAAGEQAKITSLRLEKLIS